MKKALLILILAVLLMTVFVGTVSATHFKGHDSSPPGEEFFYSKAATILENGGKQAAITFITAMEKAGLINDETK